MELGRVTCPYHPSSSLIEDYRAGDMVCGECGLVVGDRVIDVGPEWRSFSNDTEGKDKCRVGAATDESIDGTLSSSIAIDRFSKDYASYSNYQKRNHATGTDRAIITASREINIMADRINLPKNIIIRAQQLFKKVHSLNILKGYSTFASCSACLYISLRQEGVPRTFKEICAISQVSKKEIGRAFKIIVRSLETNVECVRSDDFMSRFCTNLGLPLKTQKLAILISQKAQELDIMAGRSPVSICAASIYMACHACSTIKTQKEISDVTGVAEITLRQAYKVLLSKVIEILPTDGSVDAKNLPQN